MNVGLRGVDIRGAFEALVLKARPPPTTTHPQTDVCPVHEIWQPPTALTKPGKYSWLRRWSPGPHT